MLWVRPVGHVPDVSDLNQRLPESEGRVRWIYFSAHFPGQTPNVLECYVTRCLVYETRHLWDTQDKSDPELNHPDVGHQHDNHGNCNHIDNV